MPMTLRRRAWHMSRINGAVCATDRLAAATDYVRAVLADTPHDVAEDVVAQLVATAVDVVDRLERGGAA